MLKTLPPIWLHRVVQSMAKGASMRKDLRGQLDQFDSLLEQTVETGDPAWLDPIISAWAESLTQSDLEGNTSNLTEFLNELIKLTFNICRKTLDEIQTEEVIGTILPASTFAYQRAAKYEIIAYSGHFPELLPLRADPPDQKMVKLFEPLTQNRPANSWGKTQ